MDKDLRKVVKALKEQGFEIEVTTKGHVRVSRNGKPVVTFSGTASDWRALRNGIAAARRAGFTWPPKR